jgi:hypothetical protein
VFCEHSQKFIIVKEDKREREREIKGVYIHDQRTRYNGISNFGLLKLERERGRKRDLGSAALKNEKLNPRRKTNPD